MTLATPETAPVQPFGVLPMPKDPNELPKLDFPYYVLSRDETWIHKPLHFGHAMVMIDKANVLPEINNVYLWHEDRFPRVPGAIFGQALAFFRTAFNRDRSEAMVYITYHADHGYRLFIPPQYGTYTGVSAHLEGTHIARGYLVVGTIHSHCDFGAFHSGTDDMDASEHDGLHVTIGKVDTDEPEYAVMISVNGYNFDLTLADVIDGAVPALPSHPAWWTRFLKDRDVERTTWQSFYSKQPKGKGKDKPKGKGGPVNSLADYWSQWDDEQADWWNNAERYPGLGFGAGAQQQQAPGRLPSRLPRYTQVLMLVDRLIRDGYLEKAGVDDQAYSDLVAAEALRLADIRTAFRTLGIHLDITFEFNEHSFSKEMGT